MDKLTNTIDGLTNIIDGFLSCKACMKRAYKVKHVSNLCFFFSDLGDYCNSKFHG